MLLSLVGFPLALWWGLIAGLLWMAGRAGGRRGVWIVSALGAGMVLALAGDILLRCAADPVFVPPQPGSGGDGQVIPACDGPAGMVAYVTLYLTVPIGLVGQALLTWWLLDKADAPR